MRRFHNEGGEDIRSDRPLGVRSRLRIERLRRDAVAYALVERLARQRRISLRDLLQGSRGTGNAALTRQLAMYLVHVLLSRPQDVIGLLFDRERTTVSHAVALIETLREEDPVIDAEITLIEAEGWGAPRMGPMEMRHVA
jgi:chromosomal replication initiation ATPase DnaA